MTSIGMMAKENENSHQRRLSLHPHTMSELSLPTGSADQSTSTSTNNGNGVNVDATTAPILTQTTSTSSPSASQDQAANSLPPDFIEELSSGPIHQYLSQNTSKADLTPRQVRDALATLDSVKELQSKHNLSIDYGDKTQKKQLSNAIKTVWETLGELDSEDEPVSKADLKKDAALAWKLNKEMMAAVRPTRNGAQTTAAGKIKKKTRGTQTIVEKEKEKKKGKGKKRTADDAIESDEDPDPEAQSGAGPSKPKKKKTKTEKVPKEKKEKKPPNPNSAFNRPLVLDAKMAEVCGADEVSLDSKWEVEEGIYSSNIDN